MKRFKVILFCFIMSPMTTMAVSFNVYESGTDSAYILQQPLPGIYLGQMMRTIGLKPDWQNRKWIESVHQANPNLVDSKGEVLHHVEILKFPIKALELLGGYEEFKSKLVAYQPPVEAPEPVVIPPPVQAPVLVEPKENNTPIVVNDSQKPFESSYALDFYIGAGSENMTVGNSVGNDTSLKSDVVSIGAIRFMGWPTSRIQFGIQVEFQNKTYQSPSNISLFSDQDGLVGARYGVGFRLFNSFFLRIIGENQMRNFVQFSTGQITLFTNGIHSAGLQIDTPLFSLLSRDFVIMLSGQSIYDTTTELSIESGYLLSFGLEAMPSQLNSGFFMGVRGDYHNQLPTNYRSHGTTTIFGYLGYRF